MGVHKKCEHKVSQRDCGLCNGTRIFWIHLRNAETRGITNELTEARFRWLASQSCLYCGNAAGGVDRVKNEYGYTILNSVPCCKVCNRMKRTQSAPEFLAHLAQIVRNASSYEQFKTKWIETRTGGPRCRYSSSTVDDVIKRSSFGSTTATLTPASFAPTAASSSTNSLVAPRGSRRASTAREDISE